MYHIVFIIRGERTPIGQDGKNIISPEMALYCKKLCTLLSGAKEPWWQLSLVSTLPEFSL